MDVTDYANLATARLPTAGTRRLTGAECSAKAVEHSMAAEVCYDLQLRRWHLREAAGWRRFAAERDR